MLMIQRIRAGAGVAVIMSMALLTSTGLATPKSQDRDESRQSQGDNQERDNNREPYAIGLWGDVPYSDLQATVGVPNLIADMNRHQLAFSVHDGDLKTGNG